MTPAVHGRRAPAAARMSTEARGAPAARILSVDIGSTWTKAALFGPEGPAPCTLGQDQVPTTQEDLSEGFRRVVRSVLSLPPRHPVERAPDGVRLCASSSAKGGLAIVAIGAVPDLTVSVARMAASSAGGRVSAAFSYRITRGDVEALDRLRPDIVLLCGGTDGGNEAIVLHNARALASLRTAPDIIYAGNAAAADEVGRILSGRPLRVVANVMPEMGRMDIEPARAAIRGLYLAHIIEGKGLRRVRDLCAADPLPTPLAVYELMRACGAAGRNPIAAAADAVPAAPLPWADTLLIDMGGATTDVYSLCPAFRGEEGTVLRGLEEPMLTRTVEGDLGLRVSASAAAETGAAYVAARLEEAGASAEGFAAWVARVAEDPATLPATSEQLVFDDILAEACLYHAFLRHAGSVEDVWTPGGRVRVQRGKDLRFVRRIVASGGWLARTAGSPAALSRALAAARRDSGGASLLPEAAEVLVDRRYLLPLLGNVAAIDPATAVSLASSCLAPAEAVAAQQPNREGVHA